MRAAVGRQPVRQVLAVLRPFLAVVLRDRAAVLRDRAAVLRDRAAVLRDRAAVLDAFAVVAEPGQVATELVRRFGGLVDRLKFYAPYPSERSMWDDVRADVALS